MNIKYTVGHKGYCCTIPRYTINRPGPLAEDMLQKRNKVTSFMVSSVQYIDNDEKSYDVQSVSPTSNGTNT